MDKFKYIDLSKSKKTGEKLVTKITEQLKENENKQVVKSNLFNFDLKTRPSELNQLNDEINMDLNNSFEKSHLIYISQYGTKNVAALESAKEQLFKGYDIIHSDELTKETLSKFTLYKPSERSIEYLESREQLVEKLESAHIGDVDYTPELIVRPYQQWYEHEQQTHTELPIDNILDAQDVLDNSGLSYKDLVQFLSYGIDNDEAKLIIANAYEMSPDRTNEIIDEYDITRDTLLQDGEDGFIRDKNKNNTVDIEVDYDIINKITNKAIRNSLDLSSNENRTQFELDLQKDAIDRAKPSIPITVNTSPERLREIKSEMKKETNRLLATKIKPYVFNQHNSEVLQGKELFTVISASENDVDRFAIVNVTFDTSNNTNQLVVQDERFENKDGDKLLLPAHGRCITETKKEAIGIINSYYAIAELDSRFIEPAHVIESELYQKDIENKLPKEYYSIAYKPVRERTKAYHELKVGKEKEDIQTKKKNNTKDLDLDF